MPSQMHETLIELFRCRPQLAAELLAGPLGVPLPTWSQARLDSSDLTDVSPTEYRADSVITLIGKDGPACAVVVEIQLRPDKAKRYSWPAYLTTLRARLRCPVLLLVLCPSSAAAKWCRQPISLGHPDWVLRPLVIGPEQLPVIVDTELARDSPELAVLAAVAHGDHPEIDKIFHALLGGLQTLDDERASLYADFVLASLPAAIRSHLEELMSIANYEYQSDFARRYFSRGKAEGEAKGKAEGRAEGAAHALLAVLSARGVAMPDSAKHHILRCANTAVLEEWIRRAVTVNTIDELFDED